MGAFLTRSLGRSGLFEGGLTLLGCVRMACALFGVALIAVAVIASPDLAISYLSPDGVVGAKSVLIINVLRGVAFIGAMALLVAAGNARWTRRALDLALTGNTGVGWWAMAATLTALLLIASAYAISTVSGTPIDFLVRDPSSIADLPFYYGEIEYAGILLMAGTAGATLLCASLCSGVTARFLWLGGLLTLLLACDDLFALHENSWRLGLNEKVTFAFYGMLAVLYAATHLRHMLRSPFVLLGIAALFLVAGIALDSFEVIGERLPKGWEDLLELAGLCFWSVYFVKTSRHALLEQRSPDLAG